MYIPLSFELNGDEIAQLKALYSLIKLTPLGQEQPPKITSLEELLRIEAEISHIRGKARARSLDYYASHLDHLVTALRDEIRGRVIEQVQWEKSGIFSVLASTKKENITQSILPYLAILNASQYEEIISYLDYAFTNREKIYREAQKGQRGRTGYEKLLHGPGLDNGLRASKRKMKRREKITSAGLEIVGEQIIEGVRAELSNLDALKLSDSARKLFDILAIKLTKQVPYLATAEQILKGRCVFLSWDEYMSFCGLTDRKEARKQATNNVGAIYNFSFEWDEKSKIIDPETGKRKYKKTHWKARLIEKQGIDEIITDGGITVYFTVDIAQYLSQSYIMQYNLQALTIDTNKFRHAYSLFRKLYAYYYQNAGTYKHIRISVESLLEACPNMPRPEEVKSRHYRQQIIDPFEENMNALQEAGIIASWEYCNSGGEALTDEQLRDYDFNDWLQWLVEYTLPADCPEPPKRKAHKPKKNTKPKAIALPAKTE